MSGHSKWETIKRQKQAEDQKRGKLFSKLSRAISIAVKTGGSEDPELNPKLRVAIEQAKEANMPKENIKRAISSGSVDESELEEITYEGFGPEGVAIMVQTATDNKNRTAQEIKKLFERGGGSLGGRGAVSFNFEPKGLIVIETKKDVEKVMLDLIDLGVEDVEETEEGIEAYVSTSKVGDIKEEIEEKGYEVNSVDLVQSPKSHHSIGDDKKARKILSLLDNLDDHDDVQNVFANVDIDQDILDKIEKDE